MSLDRYYTSKCFSSFPGSSLMASAWVWGKTLGRLRKLNLTITFGLKRSLPLRIQVNWYNPRACRPLSWCKLFPSISTSLQIHVFSVHEHGRDLPRAARLRGCKALNADQEVHPFIPPHFPFLRTIFFACQFCNVTEPRRPVQLA